MNRFHNIIKYFFGAYIRGILIFVITAVILGTLKVDVDVSNLDLLKINMSALSVGLVTRLINW